MSFTHGKIIIVPDTFCESQRVNNLLGSYGVQVVSVFAFYSDDPSPNPAEVHSSLFFKIVWKERK